MLADYINRRMHGPLCPAGWVFVDDAVIAVMNSIDDQWVNARLGHLNDGERSVTPSYQNIDALIPSNFQRHQLTRSLAVNRIGAPSTERAQETLHAAFAFLANGCQAGRIGSATRKKDGGPMVEIEQWKWGLDKPGPRLWRCTMNPAKPFEDGNSHYLFFEENSLHREIDAWRLQHNLERIWTEEPVPEAEPAPKSAPMPALADTPPTSKGGAPVNSEKWGNLVAVVAAYAINRDIGEMKAGELHTSLDDYASKVGLEIPAKTTAKPALARALNMLHREHGVDGEPLFDADGNPLA